MPGKSLKSDANRFSEEMVKAISESSMVPKKDPTPGMPPSCPPLFFASISCEMTGVPAATESWARKWELADGSEGYTAAWLCWGTESERQSSAAARKTDSVTVSLFL